MKGLGTPSLVIRHFNAQIYDDLAWRVSAVWVRQGSEWKEAHHHEPPLRTGS